MRYTSDQIGDTKIRPLNSKSHDVYALYVEQDDEHMPVLVGADWQACRDKTAELIERGVSEHDIYGESDARTGANWGQASKHLWLPSQV